jgi:hypothetical protein
LLFYRAALVLAYLRKGETFADLATAASARSADGLHS